MLSPKSNYTSASCTGPWGADTLCGFPPVGTAEPRCVCFPGLDKCATEKKKGYSELIALMFTMFQTEVIRSSGGGVHARTHTQSTHTHTALPLLSSLIFPCSSHSPDPTKETSPPRTCPNLVQNPKLRLIQSNIHLAFGVPCSSLCCSYTEPCAPAPTQLTSPLTL